MIHSLNFLLYVHSSVSAVGHRSKGFGNKMRRQNNCFPTIPSFFWTHQKRETWRFVKFLISLFLFLLLDLCRFFSSSSSSLSAIGLFSSPLPLPPRLTHSALPVPKKGKEKRLFWPFLFSGRWEAEAVSLECTFVSYEEEEGGVSIFSALIAFMWQLQYKSRWKVFSNAMVVQLP